MVRCGEDALRKSGSGLSQLDGRKAADRIYRAMLAASPAPSPNSPATAVTAPIADRRSDTLELQPVAGETCHFEIRRQNDIIDEVVAKNCDFHLEQLSDDSWYLGINMANGDYHQFYLGSRNRRSYVDVLHTETSPASPAPSQDAPPPRSLSNKD